MRLFYEIFYQFYFVKKILIFSFIFNGILAYAGDTLRYDSVDTLLIVKEEIQVEKKKCPYKYL